MNGGGVLRVYRWALLGRKGGERWAVSGYPRAKSTLSAPICLIGGGVHFVGVKGL